MGKEKSQSSPVEHMKRYQTRLEQGIQKAESVKQSALGLLHEDPEILNNPLPFALTERYDVTSHDDDTRFEAQLNLSVLAETITTKTLPVLLERQGLIASLGHYAEVNEQLQTHSARVTKMREQHAKGLFPEKGLLAAEERTQTLHAERTAASKVSIEKQVDVQRNKVKRIREGRANNLYTDQTLTLAEERLAIFEEELRRIQEKTETTLPDKKENAAQTVFPTSLQPENPVAAQTVILEETPEPMTLTPDELSEAFYGNFYTVATTDKAESFYTFLTESIRGGNSSFRLSDLAQEMYLNSDYANDARSYIQSQKKKMADRGWEIVKTGRRGVDEYTVLKIGSRPVVPHKETQAPRNIPEPVTEIDEAIPTEEKQPYYMKEIVPTRRDAISYIAENPDWSLDGVLDILGPSKVGRRLTWNQAWRSLNASFNRLYGRITNDQASEEEQEQWQRLMEQVQGEGKDGLVLLRHMVFEGFHKKDKKPSADQSSQPVQRADVPMNLVTHTELITSQTETKPVMVAGEETTVFEQSKSEENRVNLEAFKLNAAETRLLGAIVTDLNGIRIVNQGKSVQLQIDDELVRGYAEMRRTLRKQLFADATGKKIRAEQDAVMSRVHDIFTQDTMDVLNDILDMQDDDAYLLLYAFHDLNESFDGLLPDCIAQLSRTAWTHTKGQQRAWHTPYEIPYFDQAESVIEVPEEVSEAGNKLKIERSLPQVRSDIASLVELAQQSPAKLNFAQLRAINNQLAQIAEYAIDHGYLKNYKRNQAHVEFDRKTLVLLEFLFRNKQSQDPTILRQPKLVKELTTLIDEEYDAYLAALEEK